MTFGLPWPSLFAIAALGCVRNEGVDPPEDRFFYPTGIAAAGDFLFVANSNFDIAYNGGTIVTVDLRLVDARIDSDLGAEIDESEFIVRGSAVEIGTFANDLVVAPDGSRIFVSVRGDNSVTYADADPSTGELTCSPSPSGAVSPCKGAFVLGREENDRGLALPNEPHGLALAGDRLFVAHADGGEVSMFETARGTPLLTSVSEDFPPGSTSIAVRPDESGDPDAFLGYVTSRAVPTITRFDVVGDLGVSVDRFTPVDFLGRGGVDQRGIAFSPDFRQAYVVSRFPESLLFLDTSLTSPGNPADEFVDVIELESGPAVLAVAPERIDGAETGLVYVSCFRSRKVFVVDPVLREVVDVILTGDGPHTIVFDVPRKRAYLALFAESTIAVLDVDPQSDTYHQRLLTIGLPDPPEAAR